MIVTFRREHTFPLTLDLACRQSRPPDRIVVVDNDASTSTPAAVRRAQGLGMTVDLLCPEENTGPAGGTALAMEHILRFADDIDWITRLDDDRTEMDDDVFEELLRFATDQRQRDPTVGAVGAVGARFNWRRGRLERVPDGEIATWPIDVDFVGTNVFPAFSVAAIRAVGVLDHRLFYGFSEVEYGLRLRQHGYRVVADPVLWRRLGRRSELSAGPRRALRPYNWRRYYSLRNQIYVLRTHGCLRAAIEVSLVRGILKPLANAFLAPRAAYTHLYWNIRAIADGWRGRLGRTVPPT